MFLTPDGQYGPFYSHKEESSPKGYHTIGADKVPAGGLGEQREPVEDLPAVPDWNARRSYRIERQHSQAMAIQTLGLSRNYIGTDENLLIRIKELTDRFMADLGQQPEEAKL
jgi:hypothetical protein